MMAKEKIAEIYQGDQYYITITVRQDGERITPDDIDGIRISIGKLADKYPDGNLLFHDGDWLFPISSEQSLSLYQGKTRYQVQIKKDDVIVSSPVGNIEISKSLFGEWNDLQEN